MRKPSLSLLPITLSLGMTSAWGQLTSLDHLTKSPMQQVLGERVLAELLAATGGDDGLFLKVTGSKRLPNQKLFVSIPDSVLQLGRISYPRPPDFLTATLWDQAAMCQGTAPVAAGGNTGKPARNRTSGTQMTQLVGASVVSTKSTTIPNTGTWSNVRVDEHGPEWSVNVDPDFDYSTPVPTQRYQFQPAVTTPQALPATELKFSAPLTAEYGTKVVYRQQAVVMRGKRLPFVATAQVSSAAPLQFNVRTAAPSTDFSFRDNEQRVVMLKNEPAHGAAVPAEDAALGERVLQSANGVFLLGRDSNGAYTIVDATQSHRPATGNPTLKRVWNSPGSTKCADSDLALNTAGDLVFRCGNVGNVIYLNADGTKPCRILTVSAEGQLMCFSDRVAANDPAAATKLVFSTQAVIAEAKAPSPTVTQHAYAMTWQQLTGNPALSLSFTGEYSGDRVVTPVLNCKDPAVALPSQPGACARTVASTNANEICADTRTVMARLRGRTQDTAGSQP